MNEPDFTKPNLEFNDWVKTMPEKHWARYDLSACRLGWEAARVTTVRELKPDARPDPVDEAKLPAAVYTGLATEVGDGSVKLAATEPRKAVPYNPALADAMLNEGDFEGLAHEVGKPNKGSPAAVQGAERAASLEVDVLPRFLELKHFYERHQGKSIDFDQAEQVLRSALSQRPSCAKATEGKRGEDAENKCLRCGKNVGNPVFTFCDDCWDKRGDSATPKDAIIDMIVGDLVRETNIFPNQVERAKELIRARLDSASKEGE